MTISAPINNSIDVRLPNTPELVDDPKVFNELLMVYQAIKNLQAAAGVMKPSSITATMAAGALTFGATSRYLDFGQATLTDGANTTLLATPANLVLPSGGTLGTPTTTIARIVLVEMNIAGVAELAVVNIAGGNDLSETGLISTTAISATSTANNVFYSTTARTGVAYRVVGIVDSVNTAGAWAAPTLVRAFTPMVAPRRMVQSVTFATGAFASGTTIIPMDDTIPQNTEGDQYLSLAITPTNPLSTLEIEVILQYAQITATNILVSIALFRDAEVNALTANAVFNGSPTNWDATSLIVHKILAGSTAAQTFKVRAGPQSAATFNLNGRGGVRTYGGVSNSRITIKEYLP